MLLVIIADDFTGALDVGVQFAPYDVIIKIAVESSVDDTTIPRCDADVLVVDAETRHLSPAGAAAVVRRLVRLAREGGAQTVYLKTDSGLRGNVGATLTAALNESDWSFLAFAPAFPDMHRPTIGGVQYNEGVPIHQSPFGQDPFEPVRTSSVPELFRGEKVRIRLYPRTQPYDTIVETSAIGIFDVERNEDFVRIGEYLQREGKLGLLAGCAAFASVLPGLLGMRNRYVERPLPDKPLLVLCGSLNPITRRQLNAAAEYGFTRITLTHAQRLDYGEGQRLLTRLESAMDGRNSVILETEGIDADTLEKLRLSDEAGKQAISRATADRLGELLKRLIHGGMIRDYLPMIIGGDTLTGIMRQWSSPEITLEREIEPGVVLFYVNCEGSPMHMISKSGGFGDEKLLLRVARAAREGRKEDELYPTDARAGLLRE
ncbi:MAG: four-carbon acid sugar kinase family protein [Eubacteriales bacterium]|nr:four-carbon acid sugar kinase family protein [Eubacteriales bacterium]